MYLRSRGRDRPKFAMGGSPGLVRNPGPGKGGGPPTAFQNDRALEDLLQASEEKHGKRRRRAARIYDAVERLFFLALVILMVLAFRRFESAVFSSFFPGG